MPAPEADQSFAEFQRTGDARALATAFDALAPELLLVAAHLAPRGCDAEDLVQATFLRAIEVAGQYDPGRPVMPWLIGILGNQVRRERWLARRVPDPGRLPPPDRAADPGEQAVWEEFARQVREAIAAMPPHYRQVLTLRWAHGMGPAEIAHALGCPIDTVKTQLRRGLQLLRQGLPAGFAATLLLVFAAPRTMASVRTAVVAAAQARTAAGSAAPATGLPRGLPQLVRPVALAAAVLVVATWGAWSLARPGATASAPIATPARDSGTAQAEAAAASGAPASVPADARIALADAGPGILTVRTVWQQDGTPAPHTVLRLSPLAEADPLLREQWLVSDAEAWLRVALAPGSYQLQAHAGGALLALDHATDHQLVVLRLPEGLEVRGRVVDQGAQPVAGAGIWLGTRGSRTDGHEVTRTDARGRFRLCGVEGGRGLSAMAPGFAVPVQELLPARSAQPLTVELRLMETARRVRGSVRDARGQPVAGASVALLTALAAGANHKLRTGVQAPPPPERVSTDRDGRFELHCVPERAVTLELLARAPGTTAAHTTVRLQPGLDLDLALVLADGAAVTGQVDAGRSARALPAWIEARALGRDAELELPDWAWPAAPTAPDGSFLLAGLRPGRWHLRAGARDSGLRATRVVELTAGERLSWNPDLTEAPPLLGRVVDAKGEGLSGLSIRATAPPGWLQPGEVRTQADGSLTIPGSEDCPYTLEVRDPESPWPGALTRRPDVLAQRGTCELMLTEREQATAWLEGIVVDPTGAPLAASLWLSGATNDGVRAVADADSGRFRLGPLPTSFPWRLSVHAQATQVLDPLELRPGTVTDLGTLRAPVPGFLQITVTLDDVTPGAGRLLQVAGPDGFVWCAFGLDARGSRRVPLAPGEFVLTPAAPDLARFARRFTVRAGEDTVLEVRAALAAGNGGGQAAAIRIR